MTSLPLLFGNLGATEIIIIIVVILLFFGGKKIPELMRGIGKGVRSFKEGMNGIDKADDQTSADNSDTEKKDK